MSTYVDECTGAALDLDLRRQEHEMRHKRFVVQKLPATTEVMIQKILDIGATDLVDAPDLVHLPVTPVAGGTAFAPGRMTQNMLVECYNRCRGLKRPADQPVHDRVAQVLAVTPGMRIADIVSVTGAAKTSVRRALEMMELNQEVTVRLEPTRGTGSPRKRYFAGGTDETSIDSFLDSEVV